MKTLKNLALLSCLVLGLSLLTFSCKKDKPATPKGPELYKGHFKITNDPTPYPLNFELHADGTLIAYNNAADLNLQTGSGTYTVNNGVFNANVVNSNEPGVHYLFSGNILNSSISGTWGAAPSVNDGGTFTIDKQ